MARANLKAPGEIDVQKTSFYHGADWMSLLLCFQLILGV